MAETNQLSVSTTFFMNPQTDKRVCLVSLPVAATKEYWNTLGDSLRKMGKFGWCIHYADIQRERGMTVRERLIFWTHELLEKTYARRTEKLELYHVSRAFFIGYDMRNVDLTSKEFTACFKSPVSLLLLRGVVSALLLRLVSRKVFRGLVRDTYAGTRLKSGDVDITELRVQKAFAACMAEPDNVVMIRNIAEVYPLAELLQQSGFVMDTTFLDVAYLAHHPA